jgi:hypothetical protein
MARHTTYIGPGGEPLEEYPPLTILRAIERISYSLSLGTNPYGTSTTEEFGKINALANALIAQQRALCKALP